MAERLAGGNVALALLANTMATGAALVALIVIFGPISGRALQSGRDPSGRLAARARVAGDPAVHRRPNPRCFCRGRRRARDVRDAGCSSPPNTRGRDPPRLFSEFVATFGLLAVIWGCGTVPRLRRPFRRRLPTSRPPTGSRPPRRSRIPPSRSRGQRPTPSPASGPSDVPAFIGAQLLGAAAATALFHWLIPALPNAGADLVNQPRAAHPAMPAGTMTTRLATVDDASAVAAIYNEGIADGIATFETEPRTPEQIAALLADRGAQFPTIVVEREGRVIAWAGAGPYRNRPAYSGVAEHSVYVARADRGTGAGRAALDALCRTYTEHGFWKIVSRIFPENTTSLLLHERCGFRVVGVYRRHGRIEWSLA